MTVLGRENEKAILDELLASPKAEFAAVYGRRRVGKTFLIREYLKTNMVFDFTGSHQENNTAQLANFNRAFQEQCTDGKPIPKNWPEAFDLLYQHLKSLKKTKKAVVFMDELPWLDKQKSGFLGALQYFWNQHGSKMKHLLLVVCGSAASWIIKNIMESTGGLHNRVTRRIELKPFELVEVERFLLHKKVKFTRYQLLQLYMITGGIPFYLDFVKSGKSVHQVIEELCFTPNGILQKEFKLLYHSLFKQAEDHVAIIEALAKHPYGLTRQQLLSKTKIPPGGSFLRPIENLIDCGFIMPCRSFDKKTKDTVFRIVDLYSIFYLRFIKPNVGNTKKIWQSIQKSPAYKTWCGYAFETLCLLHVNQICKHLGFQGVHTQINAWYFNGDKNMPGAQVDLVIDRKDGIIHLFEAKFSDKEFLITKDYATKLRKKRIAFEYATHSKKLIVTSLLTTYPAIKNNYYLEEIFSETPMNALFENS